MIAERMNGKFDPLSILKKGGGKKSFSTKATPLPNGGGGLSEGENYYHPQHQHQQQHQNSESYFFDPSPPSSQNQSQPYPEMMMGSSGNYYYASSAAAAADATSPYFSSAGGGSPCHSDLSPKATSSSTTMTYWEKAKVCYDYLTFQNFLIFIVLSTLLFVVCVYVYRIIKKKVEWPRYSLIKLETPPTVATNTITAFSDDDLKNGGGETFTTATTTSTATKATSSMLSETIHKTPLLLSRPFNKDSPGDYYGTIKITKSQSAKLTVSSNHYFEVSVYTYPSWKAVYAETNINEVSFDFLDEGTYAVVVFSVDSIIGELEITKNTKRLKPPPRFHRITSQEVADKRDETLSRVVENLAPKGTIRAIKINSSPFTVWPGAVYTRVETLYAVVPEETVAIFGTFPSYGMIVEGAEDHLGSLAHEGNSSAVYRIISKQHETGGYRFVSMTVVYPDISPDSPVITSPTCSLFIYTSPIATKKK